MRKYEERLFNNVDSKNQDDDEKSGLFKTYTFLKEYEKKSLSSINSEEFEELMKKKKIGVRRSIQEENIFFHKLIAKCTRLAHSVIFKHGLSIEKGKGYFSSLHPANSRKIEEILSKRYLSGNRFNAMKREWFVPTNITLDKDDIVYELEEIVGGFACHEVGEILFNDWAMFIKKQIEIENKCNAIDNMGLHWGKDFAFFINAVGDPRINHFVTESQNFQESEQKELIFSNIIGVLGLVEKISDLSVNIQALLLCASLECENHSRSLMELLKRKVDPLARAFYENNFKDIHDISRTRGIDEFYEKAERLWWRYIRIVPEEGRQINQYKKFIILKPSNSGFAFVFDESSGVIVPLSINESERYKRIEGITLMNDFESHENKPNRLLTPKDVKELHENIQAVEKVLEEDKFVDSNPSRKTKRYRDAQNDASIKGPGFGDQMQATFRSQDKSKIQNHSQVFAHTQLLTEQFKIVMKDFMPQNSSRITRKRKEGIPEMNDYINSLGLSRNIHLGLQNRKKYYGIFSFIMDNSGSTDLSCDENSVYYKLQKKQSGMIKRKIDFFKDITFALGEACHQSRVPFEIVTYHRRHSCLKSISSLHEFTLEEKNLLAGVDSDGGQYDVECLEQSAKRLQPLSKELDCTPFYIFICDGVTGIDLHDAILELREQMAVVIGVGLMLPADDKPYFIENFGDLGIISDNPNTVINPLSQLLYRERQRIEMFL